MVALIKLEDSPTFDKQVFTFGQTNEELKERCLRLQKGCTKFMTSLGESCNRDAAFADSLEAFGGGQDDPVSVSIGGPVMSKFMSAIHELASHKELLHSQVEHVFVDRLMQFLTCDMQDAKVYTFMKVAAGSFFGQFSYRTSLKRRKHFILPGNMAVPASSSICLEPSTSDSIYLFRKEKTTLHKTLVKGLTKLNKLMSDVSPRPIKNGLEEHFRLPQWIEVGDLFRHP